MLPPSFVARTHLVSCAPPTRRQHSTEDRCGSGTDRPCPGTLATGCRHSSGWRPRELARSGPSPSIPVSSQMLHVPPLLVNSRRCASCWVIRTLRKGRGKGGHNLSRWFFAKVKFSGPHRVLALAGSGGMGEVWRARDDRLQRDVALKVLHTDLGDEAARRRLIAEARAVSALQHPHIRRRSRSAVRSSGRDVLVMELRRRGSSSANASPPAG